MKILAFAGSSSKQSINKHLAIYAASLFESAEIEILDLNDYELPLFSVDREQELGKPAIAGAFLQKMASPDLIVLSLAEHNHAYSSAFKNIFDWASRHDKNVFAGTPMLLLATSTGRSGGKHVIQVAQIGMPRYGGNILAAFSLPQFGENFDVATERISNPGYDAELRGIINKIQKDFSRN